MAIIIGAGRGIGRQISLGFAELGADVVLCARTKTQLDTVAEEIRKIGGRALVSPIDMSKTNQFDGLVEKVRKEFGHIDVLVNNAGTAELIPAEEVDEKHWDTVMDTNVKGPFFLTQKMGRVMIEQGKGEVSLISLLKW